MKNAAIGRTAEGFQNGFFLDVINARRRDPITLSEDDWVRNHLRNERYLGSIRRLGCRPGSSVSNDKNLLFIGYI